MKAFENTLVTYDQFLADVQRHKALDQYMKSTYWDYEADKGCAIGCVIHTFTDAKTYLDIVDALDKLELDIEHGNHALFEPLFGIPSQLAQLQDAIFEGLPDNMALEFPLQFAQTLKAGVDYGLVWNRFAVWMLIDAEYGVIRFVETDGERKAINDVAVLHQRVVDGNNPSDSEWAAASDAASDAARDAARDAASDAAWAAAWAAARDAARAAASAAARDAARAAASDAARAAAWAAARAAARDAARAAASDAARAAHFIAMRDKVLALITECNELVAV